MEEFKKRQRAMWAAGDYATLSEHIKGMGEVAVAKAGVEPGMDVLDVACGAGNAAIPAARAGARVTGLDLVPELLEAGRARATAAGLDVEWVEGDAEELPFAADTFDRVFSTVGHMFAPRHRRAADEMARVSRDGGVVAICCWTPEGSVGDVLRAAASYLPAPPDFAEPPIVWGTEEHVREMFPAAQGFEFERHSATIEWESIDGFEDVFMEKFGPMVAARELLGERFVDLRGEIHEIWVRWNESDDGRFVLPQEYLLSAIRF